MGDLVQFCYKCMTDTKHSDVNGMKCECNVCGTVRPLIERFGEL